MQFILRDQAFIQKISGICGILIPLVFFIFVELAILQAPWFVWSEYALSDLGVGSNSALLFNSGVILTGILAFIFSIGLVKELSNKIGGYVFMIGSFALVGIGAFPISVGLIHDYVSAAFFILLTIIFFIFAITMNNGDFEQKMRKLAIVSCFAAIVSFLFLLTIEGLAISEVVITFPTSVWCMIYGVNLIFYKTTKRVKTPAITG